ncbi:MAG: MFS transporter, partial [Actinobacteria bacterium]|nr:MFS transporter [Actinomycetota bacterium]
WAQRVAQDWLVLQLTGSGKDLGIVTGLQFLPSLIFSLWAGAIADRFNKRKILILTNVIGALSALILGVLVMTNSVELFHVYILAFTLGLSGAIDAPVRQSFNSELVAKEDVRNAVSLNSANFNAGRLIGPALSGFMIAAFDTGPSFILNAISYLFVIAALIALREDKLFKEVVLRSEVKIGAALNYVIARKDLFAVMITVFFVATFGLNFQIYNALMATKEFGKGPAEYGGLGTFVAIGSFSAALLSAKLDRRRGPKFVMSFGALFAVSQIILCALPSYSTYAFTLPICGFLALTTMISANTFVQTTTDPAIRGKVLGIYLTVFLGGSPFGSPLIGWISTLIGIRWTIALCAAIVIFAISLTYLLLQNQLQRPASILLDDVLEGVTYNKD